MDGQQDRNPSADGSAAGVREVRHLVLGGLGEDVQQDRNPSADGSAAGVREVQQRVVQHGQVEVDPEVCEVQHPVVRQEQVVVEEDRNPSTDGSAAEVCEVQHLVAQHGQVEDVGLAEGEDDRNPSEDGSAAGRPRLATIAGLQEPVLQQATIAATTSSPSSQRLQGANKLICLAAGFAHAHRAARREVDGYPPGPLS